MFTITERERSSDMYKCRDCGEYFDEPKQDVDWVEYWGSNVPMYSYYCPCCESTDFDEDWKVEEEEDAEEDS